MNDSVGQNRTPARGRIFDFEIDTSGAYVLVHERPIMRGCKSEAQLNLAIAELRAELDEVAERMRRELKSQCTITPV